MTSSIKKIAQKVLRHAPAHTLLNIALKKMTEQTNRLGLVCNDIEAKVRRKQRQDFFKKTAIVKKLGWSLRFQI
jgi:hypothetical protein